MKKGLVVLLAIAFIGFLGYACDSGNNVSSGGIAIETIWVNGASAAKLYYPRNLQTPTGATTMSAGYTQNLGNVEWLSKRVAEAGYVVLGMTPSNTWGMVNDWKDMHKNGIAKLKELNNSHNVLRGMIDTGKLQTCGHSKGGGGSLWASSELKGALKSTIGMAPYKEQFSGSNLRSITAATFIQAGASDTLATNTMTRGEYNDLPNISKMYQEYSGLGHLAWTNGATGNTANTISNDVISWMKYYLDGDASSVNKLADRSGTSLYFWNR
jgi:hypothetical protein